MSPVVSLIRKEELLVLESWLPRQLRIENRTLQDPYQNLKKEEETQWAAITVTSQLVYNLFCSDIGEVEKINI